MVYAPVYLMPKPLAKEITQSAPAWREFSTKMLLTCSMLYWEENQPRFVPLIQNCQPVAV